MIQQLLDINITNAKSEYSTNNAKLEYDNQLAQCDVSTQKGEYDISYDKLEIKMDMTEIKNSIGLKDLFTLNRDKAYEWKQLARNGVQKTVQEGNNMANPHGLSMGEYVKRTSIKKLNTNIAFLPQGDPKIWFEGGGVKINITPDKQNTNWDTHRKGEYEYTRGKFNYALSQYPNCDVTYIGGPRYIESGSMFDVNV